MLKADINAGTEYALRERRTAGAAFQRVRVIDHIRRNEWKVEWIDPNPGLIDYVESVRRSFPWKNRRHFLKDEENEERLRRHNELPRSSTPSGRREYTSAPRTRSACRKNGSEPSTRLSMNTLSHSTDQFNRRGSRYVTHTGLPRLMSDTTQLYCGVCLYFAKQT